MDVIVYDKLDGIAKGVEYNGGVYRQSKTM